MRGRARRMRVGVLLVSSLAASTVVGLVGAPTAVAAVEGPSFVTLSTDPGTFNSSSTSLDWITVRGDTVNVSSPTTSQVSISAWGNSGASAGPVGLTFVAPDGADLAVGSYPDAVGTAQRSPGQAGLDVTSAVPDCAASSGGFVVHDVAFSGGVLDRLDLTYEYRCRGAHNNTFGQVSINEPAPDPAALVVPSRVDFPGTYPGARSTAARVRVVNLQNTTFTSEGLAIGGADASQFALTADDCAGSVVASGGSCAGWLWFTPASDRAGPASATVTETDTATATGLSVTVTGVPAPSNTSWAMTGDAGDVITGGAPHLWTPADAKMVVTGSSGSMLVSLTSGTSAWTARFDGGGRPLVPGKYGDARDRTTTGHPVLQVSGDGRACGTGTQATDTGAFRVLEYQWDPDTHMVGAASVAFEYHCDGEVPAAYGVIAWYATDPPPPPGPVVGGGTVSGLTVAGRVGGAHLSWTNPDSPDFSRAVVLMRSGTVPPQTPADGSVVYNGAGDTADVAGVRGGRSYAFTVWARDASGDTGKPKSVVLHGTVTVLKAPSVALYGRSFRVGFAVGDVLTDDVLVREAARVYTRPVGTSSWHLATTARATSTGAGYATLTVRRAVQVRVTFPGRRGRGYSLSPTMTVEVAPYLHGTYREELLKGDDEVIRGTVAPASLTGAIVRLQRHFATGWRTIKTTRVTATARFRWAFRMARAGSFEYRVVMPAVGRFVAARTRPFRVHVLA